MTLLALWISIFVISFSGAMMPGPVLSVTISEASEKGFKAGPLVVLGHGLVELVLVVVLASGLSQWIRGPLFTKTIFIVGGLVLFWMGIAMVMRVRGHASGINVDGTRQKSMMSSVLMGAGTTLSTPYWYIWWASIGMLYLVQALRFETVGLMVFFSGHLLSDLVWYSLIAFGISFGRNLFSDRLYRGLVLICGFFLVCVGIYFMGCGVSRSMG
ncbi:MAG: LysE family transporter [Candidatus Latescibacterota bacterium]